MGDSSMKIIKYLFVFICFFMFGIFFVNAESCDNEDIASLKVLAKNVRVSYDFIGRVPSSDGIIGDKYNVSIQGLVDQLFVSVNSGGTLEDVYYSSDGKDGNIEFETFSSKLSFNVYSKDCFVSLRMFDITLPRYNSYANSKECKKLAKYHLDICNEWYDGNNSPELIDEAMKKYFGSSENKRDIVSFIKDNMLFFGIAGILLLIIIIFVIFYRVRRRSVLE